MNLIIKIEDGKPVNHPIAEDNLKVLIPDLDVNHPPEGFAKFVRKPWPDLYGHQIVESVEYIIDPELSKLFVTTVWTDQYHVRELTQEEIVAQAQAQVQAINNQTQQDLNAPYPAPNDGNLYIWINSLNTWLIKPPNFDRVMEKFKNKLIELGLSNMPPESLDFIDEDKKQELQPILDELQNITGTYVYDTAPVMEDGTAPKITVIENSSDLPAEGDESQGYLINSSKELRFWKNGQWEISKMSLGRLRDQVIIPAFLNGNQVKVMGVVNSLDMLDINYTGDTLDAYIVDSVNKLYTWDGTKWVETPVDLT